MKNAITIQKTATLHGQATLQGSKSQSIRGLIMALLGNGESTLNHLLLNADDIEDAMRVCQQLGATLTVTPHKVTLHSNGLPLYPNTQTIYSGNSGITTRFILPILGLRANADQPIELDCGAQMRARPIHSLINALRQLGLHIDYLTQEGMLPIVVTGNLTGGKAEVAGITSQYLSALLIALPCATNDSELRVTDLHERPYVDMTLNWLKQQQIHYHHQKIENTDYYFINGKQQYKSFHADIAGDFSSASCLIAAAALTQSHVTLTGLDMNDPQGDKKLLSILIRMGANITIEPSGVTIQGGNPLTGIEIDANDMPDLLPALAVIGTCAAGKTKIYNVAQARIKETDRIHSMTEGLRRLGGHIEEFKDSMIVYPSKLQGAAVEGYDDHRTVMALSIAGMLAEGTTVVKNSEAINKTFPSFVAVMRSLGANMVETGE